TRAFGKTNLLPRNLLVAFAEFAFESTQSDNIDSAGRANHVRQHVHLAEGLLSKRTVGRRMGQKRPVTAGNTTLLECLKPKISHLRCAGGPRKAPDSCLMAMVERLVQ